MSESTVSPAPPLGIHVSVFTGGSLTSFVPPAPWAGARVGKCYNNVAAMIGRHGGDFAYGWALTDFGPHCASPSCIKPLYRRWLNHVVWQDPQGQLWEVSPNAVIGDYSRQQWIATEFIRDPEALFEIASDEEWFTRQARYVPTRPEGAQVADLLSRAQAAMGDQARLPLLRAALEALTIEGFRPREWKVESIGERTGSIWLIAE